MVSSLQRGHCTVIVRSSSGTPWISLEHSLQILDSQKWISSCRFTLNAFVTKCWLNYLIVPFVNFAIYFLVIVDNYHSFLILSYQMILVFYIREQCQRLRHHIILVSIVWVNRKNLHFLEHLPNQYYRNDDSENDLNLENGPVIFMQDDSSNLNKLYWPSLSRSIIAIVQWKRLSFFGPCVWYVQKRIFLCVDQSTTSKYLSRASEKIKKTAGKRIFSRVDLLTA